jgi:hypothetical protein
VRVLLAALLHAVVLAGTFLLREVIATMVAGDPVRDATLTLALIGLTAWLAPKVSYRRRDALWWLTGLGGLWLFFIVAWRLAYLPYRDWPPRDDELPQAVYRREPPHVGVWQVGRTARHQPSP